MREAPVGWQCPSCVKQGARVSPTIRWRPSAPGRLGNTRLTPVVTALIVTNVAVFLWEQVSGTTIYTIAGFRFLCNRAQCEYAMSPLAVHHGQWYRLITAAFLHEGWEHIILNMITLAIVGPAVEAELGKARFLALYLLAAVGGSIASYLLSSQYELGLGASGAIFGVMGAYYVLARSRRWDLSAITGLLVVNLILGFAVSGIDWRAHLGGLITGAVVCLGFDRLSLGASRAHGRGAEIAGGAAVVASAVVVLTLLSLLPPGHVNLS
jgi:membrane associated rhomboid family serine protease